MSNSTVLNGLPTWIKAIAVVGFPVVVATYLLLAITGAIPSALSSEHEQLAKSQQQAQSEQQRQHDAQTQAQKEQSQLLRLICSSVAKSEAVSLECLRSR